MVSQLEVSHILWNIPYSLASCTFTALQLKPKGRTIRTNESIAADVKAGRDPKLTNQRPVGLYESRMETLLVGGSTHPWMADGAIGW